MKGEIVVGRAARTLSESGIYHVMFRGVNQQSMFEEERDYEILAETITNLKHEMNFKLYAYCFMINHVHLLMKEAELGDISQIMKRMLTKYARWFNIKYGRSGALIANRYKSRAVEVDEYFLSLIRYIHQNPTKAGITAKMEDYRWSSYNNYLYGAGLCDTDFVYEMVSKSEFIAFHEIIGEMEFIVSDSMRKSDDELRLYLARHGVENPKSIAQMESKVRDGFICRLKEEFSERQISRVTGLARGTVARIVP